VSPGGVRVTTFVMRTVTLFWAASLADCISGEGSALDIQPSRPTPCPCPCLEGTQQESHRKLWGDRKSFGGKERDGRGNHEAHRAVWWGGMRTACLFPGTVSLAWVCVDWASLQAGGRGQGDAPTAREGTDAQGLNLLHCLWAPSCQRKMDHLAVFSWRMGRTRRNGKMGAGIPGGSSANAGDRDAGSIPGSGRFPGGGQWQPNPVFLPGESPWTEEPGGLQSTRSQRVRSDGSDLARTHRGNQRCQARKWTRPGSQEGQKEGLGWYEGPSGSDTAQGAFEGSAPGHCLNASDTVQTAVNFQRCLTLQPCLAFSIKWKSLQERWGAGEGEAP